PLQAPMQALIARDGTSAVFAGFRNQSELPALYAASDCLVLSSVSETWGLVVNEGMACDLPAVVSSGVGCAPDMIVLGRTGEVYPSGDANALADALLRVAAYRHEPSTTTALRDMSDDHSPSATARGIMAAAEASRRRR